MAWMEREFEVGRAGDWAEVLAEIVGSPGRLEDLVRDVPPEKLRWTDGQSWSVQEHAGHLVDLESLHRGRIGDYAAGWRELRPADLSNRRTHDAHHHEDDLGDILADFRFEREILAERLQALSEEERSRVARHPRLAVEMGVTDYVRFILEHDRHHLRRIRELVER